MVQTLESPGLSGRVDSPGPKTQDFPDSHVCHLMTYSQTSGK